MFAQNYDISHDSAPLNSFRAQKNGRHNEVLVRRGSTVIVKI